MEKVFAVCILDVVRCRCILGKMYRGRLWIWKRHMIRSIGMVHVADAMSVWSWREIAESSAEFLC